MSGGFASRFAVEVAFLVFLAVAAGFADLRAWVIVLVMTAGWLVVTLIEALAWQAERELERRVASGGAHLAADDEPKLEPQHGWDVDEILAPLPEDAEAPPVPDGDAFTSVLPPEESKQ
jgi:hypothetical protein